MEEEEGERTLCQLPQVYVFKIPARKSAEGHRASDWPKDPSWTGKMKIVAKGRVAGIFLLDDKNNVFAVCQVTDDAAVERCLDSGRYFVLRITNQQGRHAFIGIAFNERNDAFDFNVALSEFRKEIEREDKATSTVSQPALDLSLKSGEKIKIKLNKKHKETDDEDDHAQKSAGGGLAFPAPRNTGSQAPVKPSSNATAAFGSDPFGSDPFGAGDPFASHSDPFGSNSSAAWSSSDPFATHSDPFASKPSSNTSKPANNSSHNANLLDF